MIKPKIDLIILIVIFVVSPAVNVNSYDYIIIPESTSITILTNLPTEVLSDLKNSFYNSKYNTSISDINFLQITTYNAWQKAIQSSQVDLILGGSYYYYDRFIKKDLIEPISNQTFIQHINQIKSDFNFDYEYDFWLSNSTGSIFSLPLTYEILGFNLNNDLLALYNLSSPSSWSELVSTNFTLSKSEENQDNPLFYLSYGSETNFLKLYQYLLQKYGWENGWRMITILSLKSKIIAPGTPTYGIPQPSVVTFPTSTMIGNHISADNFNIPTDGTYTVTNLVSFPKNGNIELASNFLSYLFENEAQSILADHNYIPVAFGKLNSSQFNLKLIEVYNYIKSNDSFINIINEGLNSFINYYFKAGLEYYHVLYRSLWDQLTIKLKEGKMDKQDFELFIQELTRIDVDDDWIIGHQKLLTDNSTFIGILNELINYNTSVKLENLEREMNIYDPDSFNGFSKSISSTTTAKLTTTIPKPTILETTTSLLNFQVWVIFAFIPVIFISKKTRKI